MHLLRAVCLEYPQPCHHQPRFADRSKTASSSDDRDRCHPARPPYLCVVLLGKADPAATRASNLDGDVLATLLAKLDCCLSLHPPGNHRHFDCSTLWLAKGRNSVLEHVVPFISRFAGPPRRCPSPLFSLQQLSFYQSDFLLGP